MIHGIVSAVPKNIERNEDAKIIEATGVRERRIVAEGQDTFTLAVAASERLLEQLGWSADTLNAIICVTQTSPVRMPAIACAIAFKLGARCPAFDVNLACSGYVYGLSIAATFGLRRTLLIAGDTVSRMVAPEDAGSRALFGDCVTATAVHEGRFINARLGTDGSGFEHLIADPFIRMDGAQVAHFALSRVPELVQAVTMNAKVDWYLFHQANLVLLKQITRKLKIAPQQCPTNIEKFGNTSSASIPLLMCASEATAALVKERQRVAMFGFGAGFSWGGVMLDIGPLQVCEVVEV
jgi:3-oxoacyl-[acyl-carrier-protein] synthase-3